MPKRIVCFGPGPLFKGGIQNYNTSLAKALDQLQDVEVIIVSWTQMYPSIFPRDLIDRTSKTTILDNSAIEVHYITNYNNPFSWRKTASFIASLEPDKVIFQWSVAIQGLPMGYIAKEVRSKSQAEIIFDCHFVIQKEGSKIDTVLSKYGLKYAHTYVTHARQTTQELGELFPKKKFYISKDGNRRISGDMVNIIQLYHPVYDLFAPVNDFNVASFKAQNGLKKNVFLFFGFIRRYKGLHHAIKAFDLLRKERDDVSLIICGESFWETLDESKISTKIKNIIFGIAQAVLLKKKQKESDYRPLELLDKLNLHDDVLLKNEYVANEDVHQYFQVSDAVLLFYEYATPSGVESISYNFKMPLLATKVGHFPETITDGYNGYLAIADDIEEMKNIMRKSIEHPINRANIKEKVKEMSWENYAKAILNL